MGKRVIIAGILMSTFLSYAANDDFLSETGGFIVRDDPGNGLVLVANAQTQLPGGKISHPVSYMRFHAKMNIGIRAVDPASAKSPSAESAKALGATIVVFVADDPKSADTVVVAPDGKWAIVNVAALNTDSPGDDILALRTRKAITRAICFVCGAGGSQYPNTLVGPFKDSVKGYDRFPTDGVPPDVFPRMQHYLKSLGVRPLVRTTYANACRQGWAPKPTNDVQRAIWEKVHALPKNPIKIEFDPKKGR